MLLLLAVRFSLAAIFSLIFFFSKLEMGLEMCEAERNLILFLSGSKKQFLNNQRQKHLTSKLNCLQLTDI